MKNQKNNTVGIDVSLAMLDTYVNTTEAHGQYANTPEGLVELVAMLKKLQPTLVVFEATGDYTHELIMALGKADIPFHQANPRWTRAYALSLGALAKTDRVDAKILAGFAAERMPKAHKMPTQREVELHDQLRWHRQLTLQQAKLKTQFRQAKSKVVQKQILALLDACKQQLVTLEAAIDELIQQDPDMRQRKEIVESVPGIGPKTARMLAVALPELGHLDSSQLASLAGVAPMNCDSGRYRGQRHIQGGRGDLRTGLYRSIVSSVTRGYNAVLHAFYLRLTAAGKPFKVAMTACVHKILTILNAMVRNGTKWQQFS